MLNQISWEAAFAIVGSIVAIVTGLFGYLIKTRNDSLGNRGPKQPPGSLETRVALVESQMQLAHTRISETKDRVAVTEGDAKSLSTKIDGVHSQLTKHEDRDVRDFEAVNKKLDKITDVVLELLTNEKL